MTENNESVNHPIIMKHNLERIVSIPIYGDDTYYEIVKRFVEEFGDNGIQDGLFLVNEELKNIK